MWPFSKRKVEIRSAPYSDALLAALVQAATGRAGASPEATSAVEAAAGLTGRVFSSAKVDGPASVQAAWTGEYGQLAAREMVRRGEAVFAIDVDQDGLRLTPAGSWDVRGDADPRSWLYRLDLFGPSSTSARVVPADGVLHFRWASDPMRPWAGLSPLAMASLTGRLLAETESALADESAGPRGVLLATPPFDAGDDDASDPTATLRETISKLAGGVALVEAGTWGHDEADRPRRDFVPQRLGAGYPDAMTNVRADVAAAVLSACGVPPALVDPRSDGTLARESLRRFFATTIEPLAVKVAAELSSKLDADVSLTFDAPAFQDTVGRANVAAKLAEHVGAGAALDIAGLSND